jgi:long-chain-fatty-acid--CoA ligase ACSBG
VETLKYIRPTIFFAVPRLWEKFEEKMKAVGASTTGVAKSLATWAKDVGYRNSYAVIEKEPSPFGYSLANFLILKRIKAALGLDESRMFLFGAAPLKKTTREYFNSLDMRLHNWYGMSETSGFITHSLPTKLNFDRCGFVIPGMELKIKNPDQSGEGEICFRGRNMFLGYFKNEEATRETIDAEGFVHSGDLGRVDKEGFLEITGRIKELIITAGGENIAPVLIEDKFKEFCTVCSNMLVVGDDRRYLSALISLKVEVDLTNDGKPTNQLTSEVITVFRD